MKALSIRQPWAWLITHGYKDIENRDWKTTYRGEFLIHTGQGMTRYEYATCAAFAESLGVIIPPFTALLRGGIVGRARIVGCVSTSLSPWFCGSYGFVIKDAEPLPFAWARGQLGWFDVEYLDNGEE